MVVSSSALISLPSIVSVFAAIVLMVCLRFTGRVRIRGHQQGLVKTFNVVNVVDVGRYVSTASGDAFIGMLSGLATETSRFNSVFPVEQPKS